MIRRGLRIALGIVIVGGALVAAIEWPFTNPWLIRAKVRLLGPTIVYAPLAYRDEQWDAVLAGVKSGDAVWLYVAVDLYPALDTHPGEEMFGAVSTVVDKNPKGAVDVLLPTYGPAIVCGEQEEGQPINHATAERRVQLLAQIATSVKDKKALEACLMTLKNNLQLTEKVPND
jgi:hypothetical protein